MSVAGVHAVTASQHGMHLHCSLAASLLLIDISRAIFGTGSLLLTHKNTSTHPFSVRPPVIFANMNKVWARLCALCKQRHEIWNEFKATQKMWEDIGLAYEESETLKGMLIRAASKPKHDASALKSMEAIYLALEAIWEVICDIAWHFEAIQIHAPQTHW